MSPNRYFTEPTTPRPKPASLIDDGFLDEQPIPSSKPYRLVPDSPRRGCWIFPFLVLASLIFVGSATPRAASEPVAAAGELRAVQGQPGAPQSRPVSNTGVMEGSSAVRSDALYPEPSPLPVNGAPQDASAINFSGLATWFPASGYQGAVPWWKPGQDPLVVAVSAFRDGRTYSTSVLVTGWCACGDRDGLPTVIDLSPRAFAELAPLSVGVVSVQVELPVQGPALPATSTK